MNFIITNLLAVLLMGVGGQLLYTVLRTPSVALTVVGILLMLIAVLLAVSAYAEQLERRESSNSGG